MPAFNNGARKQETKVLAEGASQHKFGWGVKILRGFSWDETFPHVGRIVGSGQSVILRNPRYLKTS